MRALTPEVRGLVQLFADTHEVETGFGVATWRRRSLPVAGGTDDQDAWTLQALNVLQDLMNDALARALRHQRREKKIRASRRAPAE